MLNIIISVNIIINAKVAKTSDEISKGLMFIKEPLPKNEGMIFLMPFKNNHLFWMKNTLIPLDIIYINKTNYKDKFEIIGFFNNRIMGLLFYRFFSFFSDFSLG